MTTSKLAVAVLGALFATSAQAGQYVLQASKWGASQAAAVAAAGGTVKFSNDKAGLAVVESANPNFLSAALAGGAITSGAADMIVRWTPPTAVVDAAIDPSNDPRYAIQWAPLSVQAPEAWAAGFTGAGVRVAVIDGGIYSAHEDLVGAIDVAKSVSFAGPAGTCEGTFNCDVGTFWHGTHVSGIVAARDNDKGIVGIAPEATIVGVKALHNGSGSFGAVISAIIYAADRAGGNADVINMSLGAEFPRGHRDGAELTSALNRAVNYATAQGSLVVVSAGNSARDLDATANLVVTPAESGNAIAVSATGPTGWASASAATNFSTLASYSNYGNSLVWVAGPGGNYDYPGNENCTKGGLTRPCYVFDYVISASRGSVALGTDVTGGYSWAVGTSMAAPAVSAVAALIKQRNPGATPSQMKTALAKSATDVGKNGQDNLYGRGYVNALRAVTQ